MKIGFIGCGNMAQAIIGGIVGSGRVRSDCVFVANPIQEQLDEVHSLYQVGITRDNCEVAKWADLLVLAVKPNMVRAVLSEIRNQINFDQSILVSIAAGISLEQIQQWINDPRGKVIRAMPNTPALVGEGMTALVGNENVKKEELDYAAQVFGALGKTIFVEETLFHGITAVSGSSPAMIYILIEAMADGAVKQGIKREDAYVLAAQSVLGSAKMILETDMHPGVLKDRVCSPGGTTIEMVETLEETGFRSSIMSAILAASHKSKAMSESK